MISKPTIQVALLYCIIRLYNKCIFQLFYRALMESCKQLFRAILVLPFSAGKPKISGRDDVVKHDGSISGVVFLVSVVVILCNILLVGSFGTDDDSTFLFVVTIEVTAALSIVICIVLLLHAFIQPEIMTVNDHWDRSSRLMLKFLWLFTLAGLAYSAIYIALHVDCYVNNYPVDRIQNRILNDVLMFVSKLISTGFITHFAQKRFIRKLRFYYCLLVLFLMNITVIVVDFAQSARDVNDYSGNVTTFVYHSSCLLKSTVGPFLRQAGDFLDPANLEYSLLTVLFIAQMWPSDTKSSNAEEMPSVNDLPKLNEHREEGHSGTSDESQPLYLSFSTAMVNDPRRRTWTFTNIACSVLVSMPSFILLVFRIYTKEHRRSIGEGLNICNAIQETILLLVLIRCFMLIQTDCLPVEKENKFTSKEYLILASFIGALTCNTMRLIAYILLLHEDGQNVTKTYTYVTSIFGMYFQTVFILQMKAYTKRNRRPTGFSMEYTCMFLSISNFMIWAEDSFLASQWVFADDAPTIFYGKMIWVTYYSFLFPFLIFFRFKCFIAFYGLYHKLKS